MNKNMCVNLCLLFATFHVGTTTAAPPTELERQAQRIFANRQWAELETIRETKSLNLSGTGVTETDLYILHQLPNLESLALEGTILQNGLKNVLTDRSLLILPGQLKSLKLDGQAFTTLGVRHLSRLQELQELDVYLTSIGGRGVADFSRLPNLRKLRLGTPTTETIEALCSLSGLESLEFDGRHANDLVLSGLARLPKLKHLTIKNYWTPEAAVDYIRKWPSYSGNERALIEAARTIRQLRTLSKDADELQSVRNRIHISVLQPSDGVIQPDRIHHRRNLVDTLARINSHEFDPIALAAAVEKSALECARTAYEKDTDGYERVTQWFRTSTPGKQKWSRFTIPDSPVSVGFPASKYISPTRHQLLKNVFHWHFGDRDLMVKVTPFEVKSMTPTEWVEFVAEGEWLRGVDSAKLISEKWVNEKGRQAKEVFFTYRDFESGRQACRTRVVYIDGWIVAMTWKSQSGVSSTEAAEWFSTLTIH